MNRIRRLTENIRQGLDFYITALLAGIISVLGMIGVADQTVISSAILAILCLISYGLIKNRRQEEEIRTKLLQLSVNEKLSDRFLSHDFNPYELKERIIHAKKSIFWGPTFTQTVQTLTSSISQWLQEGNSFRFLLIEDHVSSSEMAAFRNILRRTTNKVNKLVENTLLRLAEIKDANANFSGSLEVRVINYLPPWTMIATEPDSSDGFMSVRLLPYRILNDKRPLFTLRREKDNYWFQYFLYQFEAVWEEGKEIDLSTYLNAN